MSSAKTREPRVETRERQLSTSNFCHICCHESDLFCVGSCDHPICFECGVRMRVICESNECPICRSDVKTMLVVNGERLSPYATYGNERGLITDPAFTKKYGLKFENTEALTAVRDIMAHVCTICSNEPEFRTFDELSQHMRRTHEFFYCDLCVANLQLFSWERKCYDRELLAKHRRIGDPDDRSHRGHPLCEFCDQRYMDDEQIYRHLRRDHFFCHFCDADGMNKFYSSAADLKQHLKRDHFLCEEGQCKSEPLGISFRYEIDFKAHKATVHRAKQERHINLDIGIRRGDGTSDRQRNFRDRPIREREPATRERDQQGRATSSKTSKGEQHRRRDHPGKNELDGTGDDDAGSKQFDNHARTTKANADSFALKSEEFPSLNPATKAASSSGSKVKSQEMCMATVIAGAAGLSTKAGSLDENDFPTLHLASKGKKATATNAGGGRTRRSSRSASPMKKTGPNDNFVLVDDDESFVSISEQVKAAETASEIGKGKGKNAKPPDKGKENKTGPGWGPKPSPSLKQGAIAWESKDEAYPALPSASHRGTSKAQRSKQSDAGSKSWSQLLLGESDNSTSRKKEKHENVSSKQKKQTPASSSAMATDALLESLPPGLPIKSKARKVAQQKQRPSESVDDASQSDVGNGEIHQHFASPLAPPPGFEHAAKNNVPPPPGFGSVPTSSQPQNGSAGQIIGTTASSSDIVADESGQQFLYKKPSNFDLRNRALFDRLCALMGNDESLIQTFKKTSSEYRRGELDALTYCQRVRKLLGDDGAYVNVFGELVCLLPDIERQNELWNAYVAGELPVNGGFIPSIGDAVRRCSKCGQLLVKIDYYEHAQTAHPIKGANKGKTQFEEAYPALC